MFTPFAFVKQEVLAPYSLEYFIIVGGGSGGYEGGGGGAGGVLSGSFEVVTGTSYSVVIGSGGAKAVNSGSNGNDSSVFSIVAIGGGFGGSGNGVFRSGSVGGSGGGGAYSSSLVSQPGADGISGQGNKGGTGSFQAGTFISTGGGGAFNNVGGNNFGNTKAGFGGSVSVRKALNHTFSLRASIADLNSSGEPNTFQLSQNRVPFKTKTRQFGVDVIASLNSLSYYRANPKTNVYVLAGYSLTGSKVMYKTATPGAQAGAGGAGGSGVVIISYSGSQIFTGGTVTSSGGNTIHTFTSSGTLS